MRAIGFMYVVRDVMLTQKEILLLALLKHGTGGWAIMFYYKPKFKPDQIKIDGEVSPAPLKELGIVPKRKLIVTRSGKVKMITCEEQNDAEIH